MNLFKIVKNQISSQIDADEEGFKVSNCRCENVEGAIGVGVGLELFKRMVSSRLFPRLRDPEVVELLEDLNLSLP